MVSSNCLGELYANIVLGNLPTSILEGCQELSEINRVFTLCFEFCFNSILEGRNARSTSKIETRSIKNIGSGQAALGKRHKASGNDS